jgi:two-component system nitrogen regulation sensor histidine kinase NtrY
MNASAAWFFNVTNPDAMNGELLSTLTPEIQAVLDAMPRGSKLSDGQVEIRHPGQPARTLLVRVSSELAGTEVRGYVVTFDDVTDLVSAQRKAAWADVARRIAHEIKNPLTPIQLSAERLRRKYAKEIVTDPEVFMACTDTIVKHVDDIGRMVDEFSAFARMPTPVMKEQDLKDLCRQTQFLHGTSRADIRYTQTYPDQPCIVECDGRQIAQALTNLLKNAAEAIDARTLPNTGNLLQGEIKLSVTVTNDRVNLSVADNGKGLPVDLADQATQRQYFVE